MVRLWITLLCIVCFIEIYSIGVYFLAKKAGEKSPAKCFIPFYAFLSVNRLTGGFKVLSIPVKRFHFMMVEVVAVALGALLYACWGENTLPEISRVCLWEIMSIVFVLMALIAWVALFSSSNRLAMRFNVKRAWLFSLSCALVVFLPVAYIVASKNSPRALNEMYGA